MEVNYLINDDILFELNEAIENIELVIDKFKDLIISTGHKTDYIFKTRKLDTDKEKEAFRLNYTTLRIMTEQNELLIEEYIKGLQREHQRLLKVLKEIKITAS